MNWKHTNVVEVTKDLEAQDIYLPLSSNTKVLGQPLMLGDKVIPNRLAIQPMEGCDSSLEGVPEDLTWRRYERFAKSGAGLIWFEAVAICPEGRANPRQLLLNEKNLDSFKRLVDHMKEEAVKTDNSPLIIMQATHSGRYARPFEDGSPIIAYNNPLFEGDNPISSACIISDSRLGELEELQGQVAALAQKAGFDGVDIKACHRYLTSELLSAYTRQGAYGGDLTNRSRFLRNSIASAKASTGKDFIITSRLNIYDGFAYPYGFGVSEYGGIEPDLTEPTQLVRQLYQDYNVRMLDISIGNPYVNPHVNRPADKLLTPCSESPLVGLERIIHLTGQVKKACPDMAIVGSGLTYLRQYSPYLAAGAIEQGYFDIAGYGRMAFAYPDFAGDILTSGKLDAKKVCITCSSCTRLMRERQKTGCIVRDPMYQSQSNE